MLSPAGGNNVYCFMQTTTRCYWKIYLHHLAKQQIFKLCAPNICKTLSKLAVFNHERVCIFLCIYLGLEIALLLFYLGGSVVLFKNIYCALLCVCWGGAGKVLQACTSTFMQLLLPSKTINAMICLQVWYPAGCLLELLSWWGCCINIHIHQKHLHYILPRPLTKILSIRLKVISSRCLKDVLFGCFLVSLPMSFWRCLKTSWRRHRPK